ncbi:transporter substrate-binding domain-containing protein [Roseibium sp. HPY-6]|uniref:transporter substrate-binding domain-containing protein n=1 Tax=Roseibium sp. HPY-6 TaxID=3229852 RepID=UPI00338D9639
MAVLLVGASLSSVAADALEDIKSSGTIKIGIFPDFPPFSSASSDLSIQGYDIDVANFIGEKLGVDVELVNVTGQNRIPLLNDKRVDVLMSVGYSDERFKVIDYAAPYAPYYIGVIGPAAMKIENEADLAGKTVAVNRGTLEDTSLTKAASDDTTIRRFDNYSAVIQAFISGQVDLMVVGNDVGARVLAEQTDLEPEQKFQLLTSPSHVALNHDEEPLKAALKEAIAEMMESGALNTSSEKWLKVPLDPANLVRN